MRPAPALLVASLATACGREALASPAARLVYSRAPEASSCPDELALRKAVAARVGYDPFFPWAKQTVVVHVGFQRRAYTARVERIDEAGVARGTRDLSSTATDCVEIFDATALAISIALDAASPPAPPSDEAATPAPVAPTSPAPPPVPAVVPPPIDKPPLEAAPSASSARPPLFFAGAELRGSLNTAPSPAAGGALVLGARARSLSGGLELLIDAPASAKIAGGSVTSWLYAASLVPCAHYGIASLCAVGSVGSLHAWSSARESLLKSTLFAVAGPRVALELPLTRTLSLRAHADLLFNLAPTSLFIDGNGWTTPSFALCAGIGVVVHFP